MIKSDMQRFLDHCIEVLNADTITHKVANNDRLWNEAATVGGVTLSADYTDRDYPGDRRVDVKYVVGSEYKFKISLDKFLTLTRADIEKVEQQAAIFHNQYMRLLEETKRLPVDAKKQLQSLLT